ncbi:MAG: hypothetical protein AB1571_02510 [Nanoarchaeota archaeon]
MSEISDKLLIVLVIVAIAVSLFGTTATISKLSNLGGLASISGAATSTPTGVVNISVVKLVFISLPVASIDFGSLEVNQNNNTIDDSPLPFQLQNDGTTNANVTIGASDLFTGTGASNPSSYYQFKSSLNESGSVINSTLDLVNEWINMPTTGSPIKVVSNLKYQDLNDLVKVHINVTVPSDEPAGAKSSTVIFTGYQA